MHPNFVAKFAVTQWFAFVHLCLAPRSFWYMNHRWDKTRLPRSRLAFRSPGRTYSRQRL
jgi:hypothetical protein